MPRPLRLSLAALALAAACGAASLAACAARCCPIACDPPAAPRGAFDIVPVATRTSLDGGYRLQIEAVLRRADGKDETVQMHTRVKPWGNDLIVDSCRLDGLAEGTPPTHPTSGPLFSVQRRQDGHVVADGIPIVSGSTKLGTRRLAIDIGRVGTWRVERLRMAGAGRSNLVRCGPFAIQCVAEPRALTVVAFNPEETEADWRAYQSRVPLHSIGHRWISEGGLTVHDASGAEILWSVVHGEGGGTSQLYPLFGESKDIAYPVTIQVRVPENVTMKTIEFDLKGVDIPAARAP